MRRLDISRVITRVIVGCLAIAIPATQAFAIPVQSSQDTSASTGDNPTDIPGNRESRDPLSNADDQIPVVVPPVNPFPEAVAVPAGILDGGTEWLNTAHPIDITDLKGKIVILDFWTYCCINCMHVLPDLKFLEEKYAKQVVVIGVHSAKFENEKLSANIRDAILRYDIHHPVVNDSEMIIWRKFGTRAWPTLAIIDPEGKFAGSQSGEGQRQLFDSVIEQMVKYHRWKGTLDENPIVFESEASKAQPTPLRYPGKVLVDGTSNRVFVTDSNHNRIIVANTDGQLLHVMGTGRVGRSDGAFDVAEFNHPQGTVLVENKLYVADTENHLLRVVDLEALSVTTLAGTGQQGQLGLTNGKLLEIGLNSPWSLSHVNGTLFVAMAGPHQIWAHQLRSDSIRVYAGSGKEDVINGPLTQCAFAQPSEIVASPDGDFLYVVDSEGSAVRKVPSKGTGRVSTIAGTSELPRGQSLFAFGNVDGVGSQARFQHPLGITVSGESLIVADSYNHTLRRIELPKGKVSTIAGTGKAGNSLQPLELSEPGGLSISGSELYIADTNNHRIVVMNLESNKARVFEISGLNAPGPSKPNVTFDASDAIDIQATSVRKEDKLSVSINLGVPEGYKLNDLAPVTWEIFAEGQQTIIPSDTLAEREEATVSQYTATFDIPLTGEEGTASLLVRVGYGYCGTEENALCRLATATWRVPLTVSAEAKGNTLELAFPIPADQ